MPTRRTPWPFLTQESHDPATVEPPMPATESPSEQGLDSAIEESFPANAPVLVTVSPVRTH
jgi:hypothetical protein